MLGSILSNILLVMGCAFLAGQLQRLGTASLIDLNLKGGTVATESHFQQTAAQA